MIVTAEMVMMKSDCRICGAKVGTPCLKGGKPRSRNHHERQIDAQKLYAGKAPKQARPKEKTVRQSTEAGFYSSWEWKKARYVAIKMHGRRCQCCGWTPGDTPSGHLVVDHIKPRRMFPELSLDVSNLQVLCNDCNMGKASAFADDFRGLDAWLSDIGKE